ncbi:hypothetical protein [Leisingera sp. JC1]|uniref:hypothetical protein n=1 Tax=Leisingera sp. JC1 TaxID=1855282 RepID=UPI000803A67B|nr:hypothetical protein [Leisingera sp. JC1]OBY25226.1 hypothetical protein A9D60_22450 [Leisingera sp. JC1]
MAVDIALSKAQLECHRSNKGVRPAKLVKQALVTRGPLPLSARGKVMVGQKIRVLRGIIEMITHNPGVGKRSNSLLITEIGLPIVVLVFFVWVVWLVFSLVGDMARARGHNPWPWWLLSIAWSPFASIVILWLFFSVEESK